MAKVQVRQLTSRPLILDFRNPRRLRAALRELGRIAAEDGFELTVEKVGQTRVIRAHPLREP